MPGVTPVASLALLVFFGVFVFVFAFLADGKDSRRSSLREAIAAALELAEGRNGAAGRFTPLARQLVFATAVLALVLAAGRLMSSDGVMSLLTVVVGPLAISLLAAWYLGVVEPQAPWPDVGARLDELQLGDRGEESDR